MAHLKAMEELFGFKMPFVSKCLKNTFSEVELAKNMVVSKMEITTQNCVIKYKCEVLRKYLK